MIKVFLSYSRQDVQIVNLIFQFIRESKRLDIWFDLQDIGPGDDWALAIKQGIESADAVLLLASEFSMNSAVVEDEWRYGVYLGKPILIWLLSNCTISPELQAYRCFDLRLDPLDVANWHAGIDFILDSNSLPSDCPDLDKLLLPTSVKDYIADLRRCILNSSKYYAALILIFLVFARELLLPLSLFSIMGVIFAILEIYVALYILNHISNRKIRNSGVEIGEFSIFILRLFGPLLLASGGFVALDSVYSREQLPAFSLERILPLVAILFVLYRAYKNLFARLPNYPPKEWFPQNRPSGSLRAVLKKRESRFVVLQSIKEHAPRAIQKIVVIHEKTDVKFARYVFESLKNDALYDRELACLSIANLTSFFSTVQSLKGQNALLLVVSPYSRVLFERFVEVLGDLEGITIVPILLQDTAGISGILARYQWVDARAGLGSIVDQILYILRGYKTAFTSLPARYAFPQQLGVLLFLSLVWMVIPVNLFVFLLPFLYGWSLHSIALSSNDIKIMTILFIVNIFDSIVFYWAFRNRRVSMFGLGFLILFNNVVVVMGWGILFYGDKPLVWLLIALGFTLLASPYFSKRALDIWLQMTEAGVEEADYIKAWEPQRPLLWFLMLYVVSAICLFAWMSSIRQIPTAIERGQIVTAVNPIFGQNYYQLNAIAGDQIIINFQHSTTNDFSNGWAPNVTIDYFDDAQNEVKRVDVTDEDISSGNSVILTLGITGNYFLHLQFDGRSVDYTISWSLSEK